MDAASLADVGNALLPIVHPFRVSDLALFFEEDVVRDGVLTNGLRELSRVHPTCLDTAIRLAIDVATTSRIPASPSLRLNRPRITRTTVTLLRRLFATIPDLNCLVIVDGIIEADAVPEFLGFVRRTRQLRDLRLRSVERITCDGILMAVGDNSSIVRFQIELSETKDPGETFAYALRNNRNLESLSVTSSAIGWAAVERAVDEAWAHPSLRHFVYGEMFHRFYPGILPGSLLRKLARPPRTLQTLGVLNVMETQMQDAIKSNPRVIAGYTTEQQRRAAIAWYGTTARSDTVLRLFLFYGNPAGSPGAKQVWTKEDREDPIYWNATDRVGRRTLVLWRSALSHARVPMRWPGR
jgi:hypothetical protein